MFSQSTKKWVWSRYIIKASSVNTHGSHRHHGQCYLKLLFIPSLILLLLVTENSILWLVTYMAGHEHIKGRIQEEICVSKKYNRLVTFMFLFKLIPNCRVVCFFVLFFLVFFISFPCNICVRTMSYVCLMSKKTYVLFWFLFDVSYLLKTACYNADTCHLIRRWSIRH